MTEWTKRRNRRRTFTVRFGVFIAVFFGVIGQHVVESMDPKALEIAFDFSGVASPAKIVAAFLFSAYVYWKLDGKGDLVGKIKNMTTVSRALALGFMAGWSVGDVIGKLAEVLM